MTRLFGQKITPKAAPGEKRFNRLWQRIFACTLLLVILCQLAVFTLFYFTQDREYRKTWLEDYVGSLVTTLEEEAPSAAAVFLRHINRSGPRMWFEAPGGSVVLGQARPGYTFSERERFDYLAVQRGKVTITDTALEGRTTFCIAPVRFSSGLAFLCYAFPGYDSTTLVQDIFYQGFLALLVAGGLLSFWIARVVASPILALRDEALEITENNFQKRVTLQGYDEILDMAKAVNTLTENLVRHIVGMQTLLANISHEMRSPLTRAGLYSFMIEEGIEELQRDAALPEKGEACFEVPAPTAGSLSRAAMLGHNVELLQEELRHLEGIIGASLLLSKLDLQANSDDFEPVAFSELCASMARRYEAVFEAGNIDFSRHIAPGLMVRGDETLLCHMLSNLLDNALKYTKPGGQARLFVRGPLLPFARENRLAELELRVENLHPSLTEEMLQHLFEPFYRAGMATGNGVGLGLALVKRIAALHGGSIRAGNMEENGGNIVHLTLRLPTPGFQ